MKNNYDILFNLGISEPNELPKLLNCKFKYLKIISETKYELNILLDDYLPINELELFFTFLNQKNRSFIFDVMFEIKNPINSILYLEQYLDFILKYYKSFLQSLYFKVFQVKNKNFKFENGNLSFLVLESFFEDDEKLKIENDLTFINNKFLSFGFLLQFKLEKLIDNIQSNPSFKNDVSQKEKNLNISTEIKKYKNSYNSILKLYENNPDSNLDIFVSGKIFDLNRIDGKNNWVIFTFFITDYTDSIIAKCFIQKNNIRNEANIEYLNKFQKNDWINVKGKFKEDSFMKEKIVFTNPNSDSIKLIKVNEILTTDDEEDKRIELHTHTKMSTMDGLASAKDYINYAYKLGHRAVAITDFTNIQSFPDAHNEYMKKYKNTDFKLIYGAELNMIDENIIYVTNPKNQILSKQKYVIFDLETTGLNAYVDEIIEFGAVVYDLATNIKLDEIDILIKPTIKISSYTKSLTNLSDELLEQEGISIESAMEKIVTIFQDAILVAHNAPFDMSFIHAWMEKLKYPKLNNTVIDTLTLSKYLWPNRKSYRLGSIVKLNGLIYDDEDAHRANYDANVLYSVFLIMLSKLKEIHNLNKDSDLCKLYSTEIYSKTRGNHITVLIKNQKGLVNLFKLITISHTQNFYGSAKILKKNIENLREGLFIGSGCLESDIFESALSKSDEELTKIINFYDYIEVQPPSLFIHLVQKSIITYENLLLKIKRIIKIAMQLGKKIVATGDVKYIDEKDSIFHEVYIHSKQIGGKRHLLYDHKKTIKEYPKYHFRTTKQMKKEFDFLKDKKLIQDIVVNNTKWISDNIEQVYPIKDKLYTPIIENSEKKLHDLCYENAYKIYGKVLPVIVEKRLKKELDAIIKHGFAVIYWIAHKLVTQSISDGYLVGSRGSVGSSLVATLANITEINPLPPHYICLKCNYSDFSNLQKVKSGFDLEPLKCQNCNSQLKGEGHNIPFETFLGFEANKVPDIDLNFSSEYQHKAHSFIKEMFGADYVLRAGTISTVAKKTAFGYVNTYLDEKQIKKSKAEIERMVQACEGVRRTTGQHPGGILIIPKQFDVNDFTPANFPADDLTSGWKTSHFDFHAIHDNILKLDILGHIDPTALKLLHIMTGKDPKDIPVYDKKVLSLFSTTKELKLKDKSQYDSELTGAIGIPEFGTKFVRQMLEITKPSSFSELVQISGLSHGTDVWIGNAKDLIENNNLNISLTDVIGCRDDIMTFLSSKGIDPLIAFTIMESVRKGQGISKEYIDILNKNNIPQWYIDSCNKIKYMFPKAHATAYVLMAWRIAWYKINYPAEYYATFFSTRTEVFDIKTLIAGADKIREQIQIINEKIQNRIADKKEKDLIVVYEVALEMWERGISLHNIDLQLSDEKIFKVHLINNEKVIIPPFIAIDGLGEKIAKSIVDERNLREKPIFISVEDFQKNTNITKTHLQILKELKVLENLPSENQLQLKF